MKIKEFLMTYLPTFCYQDFREILLMAEQVDEDVNVDSLSAEISKLVRDKVIESKIPVSKHHGTTRGFTYVYRRVG